MPIKLYKRFSDDKGIQFIPEKYAKVTFKNGSLVKSKTSL